MESHQEIAMILAGLKESASVCSSEHDQDDHRSNASTSISDHVKEIYPSPDAKNLTEFHILQQQHSHHYDGTNMEGNNTMTEKHYDEFHGLPSEQHEQDQSINQDLLLPRPSSASSSSFSALSSAASATLSGVHAHNLDSLLPPPPSMIKTEISKNYASAADCYSSYHHEHHHHHHHSAVTDMNHPSTAYSASMVPPNNNCHIPTPQASPKQQQLYYGRHTPAAPMLEDASHPYQRKRESNSSSSNRSRTAISRRKLAASTTPSSTAPSTPSQTPRPVLPSMLPFNPATDLPFIPPDMVDLNLLKEWHGIFQVAHEQFATKGQFTCPVCQKCFQRFCNFRSHFRIHISKRPFECNVCHNRFLRKHDLNRHEKIHLGVKPFECDRCGKGFVRKDALRRHQNMEPSVKRFRCIPKGFDSEASNSNPSSPASYENEMATAVHE